MTLVYTNVKQINHVKVSDGGGENSNSRRRGDEVTTPTHTQTPLFTKGIYKKNSFKKKRGYLNWRKRFFGSTILANPRPGENS